MHKVDSAKGGAVGLQKGSLLVVLLGDQSCNEVCLSTFLGGVAPIVGAMKVAGICEAIAALPPEREDAAPSAGA